MPIKKKTTVPKKTKVPKVIPIPEVPPVVAVRPKWGQPTKYKPEYCDMLIAHMKSGLSFESFSAEIGVHRETLYEWVHAQPAFSDAKKVAYDLNLGFWEKQGVQGLWGDKTLTFNSAVWIFNMKNRHKWRDRQEIEATMHVEQIEREKVKKLSMSELTELVKNTMPTED